MDSPGFSLKNYHFFGDFGGCKPSQHFSSYNGEIWQKSADLRILPQPISVKIA